MTRQPSIQSFDAFRPQARFDLEWIHYPSDCTWVAHDPVSGEFYRFSEYEYAAFRLMDGSRSIRELLDTMKRHFGRIFIDLSWIQELVRRLQSSMLLQPTISTLRLLDKRNSQQNKLQAWKVLRSPLAIKIPLFNPGRLLEWFYLPARIFFSAKLAFATLSVGLLALALIVRWSMTHGLPQVNPARITIDRWLLLLMCYGFVKSLHELGHMLACARFKVRSSEVGIMLLCLMPCFYCDTTDAWRLPKRWQRAIISAAGIYVELIIATVAAICWLFLRDGTLDLICMNLMLVCSISTVFVNANPLLRYDGYYILSDLWGVPNLHDQSKTALRYMFTKFVLLQPSRRITLDGNLFLLAGFAMLSWLYRVFVMTAILWMLWTILPPIGLQLVSVAVTASIAVGVFLSQKVLVSNAILAFRTAKAFDRSVMTIVWCLIVFSIVGFLFFPIPRYVSVRGHIDYEDKSPIYATYDARIDSVVDKYSKVSEGSLIVQLDSPIAELDLAKVEGEIHQVESNLEQMKLRRTIDPDIEYKIPQLKVELTQLRARQAVLAQELSQLHYFAPSEGYLIDTLVKPRIELSGFSESRFHASLLESENTGAWVNRGSLLGWFSGLQRPVVVALVPEDSLNGLVVGGSAIVRLDSDPFHAARGQITKIALDKVVQVPPTLTGDQSLASMPKGDGGFEPETPHYAVTILLEESQQPLYGTLATVSVQLETIPIYRHLSDFVQRSLRPITK